MVLFIGLAIYIRYLKIKRARRSVSTEVIVEALGTYDTAVTSAREEALSGDPLKPIPMNTIVVDLDACANSPISDSKNLYTFSDEIKE